MHQKSDSIKRLVRLAILSLCFCMIMGVVPDQAFAATAEGAVPSSQRIRWTPSHNYSTAGLDEIIKAFNLKGYWSYHHKAEDYKSDADFEAMRKLCSGKSNVGKVFNTSNGNRINAAKFSGTNLTKMENWVNAMGTSNSNPNLVGSNYNFTGNSGKANTWSAANKYRIGDNHYYGYSWYTNSKALYRECDGFGCFIAYLLSGASCYKEWNVVKNVSSHTDLRVGDLIRANGHTAVIYSISSTGYIQFIQACGSSYNKIVLGDFQSTNTPHNWKDLSALKPTVYRAKDNNGSTPSTPALPEEPTISGETKPTGDAAVGTSFGLRGKITCKYNITAITAKVIDRATGADIFIVTVNPNATSYSIGDPKSEKINSSLGFGKLPKGHYKYVLTATYNKDGVSLTKELINSDFTRGNPGELKILATSIELECYDTPIRDGQNEGFAFIGSSMDVAAYVFPDEASQTVAWESSNTSVATVNDGHVERVGVGSAVITCSATDGSGVKVSFTENVRCEHKNSTWITEQNQKKLICDTCKEVLDRVDITPVDDTPSPTVPTASAQLTASASSMQADGTFTVTLGIKNNPGFAALGIMSDYSNAGISLVDAQLIDIAAGQTLITGDYISVMSTTDIKGDGNIFLLTLKSESKQASDFTLAAHKCSNQNGTEIVVSNITVSIASGRMPGDANKDGSVDIIDAMLVARKYCGYSVIIDESNSDVNQDGSVDIIDAMLIARYYCGYAVTLK